MKATAEKQDNSFAHKHFYEDVFMNIPSASAIISTNSDITAFNNAFEELFQVGNSGLDLSLSFEEIDSSFWKKPDVLQHLQEVLQGDGKREEVVFDWQHEDGTLKYVRLQSQGLSSDASKFIFTFCDISEEKQAEKDHHLRIRHMMHELRNPLSNISLCVELLADSTKENNQEDTDMFLSKASASVQRMKQIINDLNTTHKAS